MPIARRPGSATMAQGSFVAPAQVVVPLAGLSVGVAVAILEVDGTPVYRLCGALEADFADSFVGFVYANVASGNVAKVLVGRGSIVSPLVEGGGPLTPNRDVYLAVTPGRVTQTNLLTATMRRLRVGHAFSATQMTLVTDFRYIYAG